jgi:hypothetical protein
MIRHINLRCPIKKMMKQENLTSRREESVDENPDEHSTNKNKESKVKTKRKMDEFESEDREKSLTNKRQKIIESVKEKVVEVQDRKIAESIEGKLPSTSGTITPVVIKLVKNSLLKSRLPEDIDKVRTLPLVSKVKSQPQTQLQKSQSLNSQNELDSSSVKFILDFNPTSKICKYCGNEYSSVHNVKRHINLRCPVVKKMLQK